MDIQYTLDPYACVGYIINYIGKSQQGLSKLIKDKAEQVRKENYSIQNQLRSIVNVFINKSEISAQEIAYHILNIPLSVSSKRYPNSTDIMSKGLIDHYIVRPKELELHTLADLAAYYEYSHFQKRKTNNEDINDDNSEHESENETDSYVKQDKWLKLDNNSGYIFQRNTAKVIKYRNYSLIQDENNYYREQLLLFSNWRNENEISDININLQNEYINKFSMIQINRSKYVKNNYIEHDIQLALEERNNEDNEYIQGEEFENYDQIPDELQIYETEEIHADIIDEITNNASSINIMERITLSKQLSDNEYYALIRILNDKQYRYHLNFIYQLRNMKNHQFYHFISGGAGVGKSKLISAITQTTLRHFNRIPGNDPNNIYMILCAPMGKAAFNIGGTTIRSAFHLPLNQDVLIA
ncbi:hypothetical protein KPH14_002636 [Odynerus spinipes]|uniref:ATP-dependent DNA helicase n=1 Tax=Odynerus spinipes TaxID=1348599 RepID=A0AAD9VM19_9HYME|nr:hypothetical protein KPH14_002636 [Odynerus spinipes]